MSKTYCEILEKQLDCHCSVLDNGLGFGRDLQTCSNASKFVQDTLTLACLLINKEKSFFQPVQCLEWLGLVWDSRLYSMYTTKKDC